MAYALRVGFLAVVLAALSLGGTAKAATHTWYLTATFDDGGTLSGQFDYDDVANVVSNVNVVTTGGTVLAGAAYTTPGNPTFGALNAFVTTGAGTSPEPGLFLRFSVPLTAGPGTYALLATPEGDCAAALCSSGVIGNDRTTVSGFISTTFPVPIPATSVPTLSEWAMILLGLTLAGGAAVYIQRRRFAA